jgi:hypothetical protein
MLSPACLATAPVEHMRRKVELKLTQVGPCGVTAPRIIIVPAYALEGRGLVDRNAAGTVLVFEVWILYRGAESGELVRFPGSRGRFWFWSRQIMKGFVGRYRWGRHGWRRWGSPAETDTGKL